MTSGPNPLTWNGFVTQIGTMAVVNTTTTNGVVVGVDDAFNAILPQLVSYAEQRICRDLDLEQTLTSNAYALTLGSNLLQIPVSDFVTVQTMGVTSAGALFPLLAATKEFLQNVYGDPSSTGQPLYFAPYGGDQATAGNTSTNFLVGPYPDMAYPVSVTGTIRPPSLYLNATQALAGTVTTFISQFLPEMLIQASMQYITLYQRNFAAEGSNSPDMAGTYEAAYQNLLKGAIVEEARKRFQSTGWASQSPALVATPTR